MKQYSDAAVTSYFEEDKWWWIRLTGFHKTPVSTVRAEWNELQRVETTMMSQREEKHIKAGEAVKRRESEIVCVCMYFYVCGIHHRRPWHTSNITRTPDDQKDECWSERYCALIHRLNICSIFNKLTSSLVGLCFESADYDLTSILWHDLWFSTFFFFSGEISQTQVRKKIFLSKNLNWSSTRSNMVHVKY